MGIEDKIQNAEECTWLSEYVTYEQHIANKCIVQVAMTVLRQRKAKGYTQKDLAKKLGVSQAMVSRWENGDENFTIETLARIAIALDLELRSPFEYQEKLLKVADGGKSEYTGSK